MAGKKTALWVVAILGGLMLLCCGGSMFGIFSWFKGSMAEAEKSSPFVSSLLTKMSDANYEFDPVADQFDQAIFTGPELDKFKSYLRLYKERLGKFKSLGKAIGFFTETNNGTSLQKYSFEATFEKASGSVSVVFKNGDKSKVAGFSIVSPALD